MSPAVKIRAQTIKTGSARPVRVAVPQSRITFWLGARLAVALVTVSRRLRCVVCSSRIDSNRHEVAPTLRFLVFNRRRTSCRPPLGGTLRKSARRRDLRDTPVAYSRSIRYATISTPFEVLPNFEDLSRSSKNCVRPFPRRFSRCIMREANSGLKSISQADSVPSVPVPDTDQHASAVGQIRQERNRGIDVAGLAVRSAYTVFRQFSRARTSVPDHRLRTRVVELVAKIQLWLEHLCPGI
jgi:hypothetical protein